MQWDDYREFYGAARSPTYAHVERPEHHGQYQELKSFVADHSLNDRKCLEIGSAIGVFQDMVTDYSGTDISEELAIHYHKPYRVSTGERYPFEDGSFDAIWTITVYEHIPYLQQALMELK